MPTFEVEQGAKPGEKSALPGVDPAAPSGLLEEEGACWPPLLGSCWLRLGGWGVACSLSRKAFRLPAAGSGDSRVEAQSMRPASEEAR